MVRYIDADELIADGWHLERHAPNGRCLTMMSIADVPTADVVEVKHGYWEEREDSYFCSECGSENCYAFCKNINKFTDYYCPNCGAKMDGGENNE